MEYFVEKGSIVREIWGKADTILFIFAGASAEFAVNKAVDWLYFTGKLPADPLGRLFSTVAYSRRIIFSKTEDAYRAIDQITAIHQGVEKQRKAQIPDWAYRDVLFMLVDYSIRAFEVLERKLTEEEKNEALTVFVRVGSRMGIAGLPQNYELWKLMRTNHMSTNLIHSHFTDDLFKQYRKHLGPIRYFLLKQVQILVVPEPIRHLLSLGNIQMLAPMLLIYKSARYLTMDRLIKNLLLPPVYVEQVNALDINSRTI